ncbi:MAG: glycosyltransferase family 39 protein [Elusimicrobia bacterium]|nr:glycosyltransferase family 39 protein [Elusimicrobiota bacterium]
MIRKLAAWFEPERNFLAAWLGLAFLLRLAFALKTGAAGLSPDAYDWVNTAWSVATGQGFGGSWRPPGYAFYLAGIFLVFGKSVMIAKAANAALGAATVWAVYLAARDLFTPRSARIAAALLSFYPYLIAYSGDLLSETFLTFILAVSVLAIVRAGLRPSWKTAAAAGAAMGLTALTKSTVLPFFLLACAWIWWRSGSFRAGFLAGVFTLLTIAPWTLRNYYHYDKSYVMPVNTPWYSLYGGACDEAMVPESLPELDSPPTDAMFAPAIPKDWDYVSKLPLPERDKYCKEKALSWIKNNPEKFRTLLWGRFKHFWHLYPVMAWPWQKRAALFTSGVYIPLCALGFVAGWRRWRDTSLLLALLASYTAVHLFFTVTLRYRVPIDPYVIIMAALALDLAMNKLRPAPGAAAKDQKS